MFGKEELISKGNTSIISKDLFIKGNIVSDSIVEIEGKVEGDIKGNIVTLREEGLITGNVNAKIFNIKGKFLGIARSERINISKKGNVKGTLEYESLCVEDGASIEGDIKRIANLIKDTESNSTNDKNTKSNNK